jgi:methyl-accepting chemotaxis protein
MQVVRGFSEEKEGILPKHPVWRRKEYLVDKPLQQRFAVFLLLQMTIILLIIGLYAYLENSRFMQDVLSIKDAFILQEKLHLNAQAFLLKILIVLVLTAFVIMFFGLYFSHKIAGPVFKLKRYLKALGDGNFAEEIQFRRTDYLEELQIIVNRLVDKFRTRQREGLDAVEAMQEEAARLSASTRSGVFDRDRFIAGTQAIARLARKTLAARPASTGAEGAERPTDEAR